MSGDDPLHDSGRNNEVEDAMAAIAARNGDSFVGRLGFDHSSVSPEEETNRWLKSSLIDARRALIRSGHRQISTDEDRRIALELAATFIIESVGGDLKSPHYKGTPKRFADMFLEEFIPKTTIHEALQEMYVEETYDEMLIVRDIPIRCMCPHHLLPWFGRATVGYIPGQRTVGLSKITRAIEAAGRGPKLQESVTESITHAITEVLEPLGAMCVIEAVHMCTLMRGVKTELQRFTTSNCMGVFRDKPEARQEFLTLSLGKSLQW